MDWKIDRNRGMHSTRNGFSKRLCSVPRQRGIYIYEIRETRVIRRVSLFLSMTRRNVVSSSPPPPLPDSQTRILYRIYRFSCLANKTSRDRVRLNREKYQFFDSCRTLIGLPLYAIVPSLLYSSLHAIHCII